MGKLCGIGMVATTLLVTLLVLQVSIPSYASKADVNIFNEVGETILVHCRSGDTDLQKHFIPAGGKYGWGFTPNYLKNTLFWCHFGWHQGMPQPSFDVWTDTGFMGQRTQPCKHCEWHVRPDGFYRNEAGKPSVLVHGWN